MYVSATASHVSEQGPHLHVYCMCSTAHSWVGPSEIDSLQCDNAGVGNNDFAATAVRPVPRHPPAAVLGTRAAGHSRHCTPPAHAQPPACAPCIGMFTLSAMWPAIAWLSSYGAACICMIHRSMQRTVPSRISHIRTQLHFKCQAHHLQIVQILLHAKCTALRPVVLNMTTSASQHCLNHTHHRALSFPIMWADQQVARCRMPDCDTPHCLARYVGRGGPSCGPQRCLHSLLRARQPKRRTGQQVNAA